MKFIIGKKLGMTSIHEGPVSENVTVISCAPNTVTQIRTTEKDGYAAVQVETDKTSRRKVRMEFRPPFTAKGKDETAATALLGEVKQGDEVSVSSFEVGDIVDVSGVTKAKGFQGVVKRHGFGGAPASHGRKHDMRKPGSIGATFPEHVVKGRRMAGRMGGENFTVRGLRVVLVDAEKNLIAVRGAVPGINGGIVGIRGLGKKVGVAKA
ncbi:MAG: 50S ribosomal protein L3 [Candidatus Moranbacteria bacterium]|nr:50S ribosomal protein L3 [Candidatus Moranbacteria bacterium]NTW46170.1 50S ribosomal protein L3 [Candidatus Moranbacteria bacterium]